MTSPDKLHRAIDDLWHKHLPLMQSRIEMIRKGLDALRADQLGENLRTQAARSAHHLAGSLGTFGLQSGSDAATEIEKMLSRESAIQHNDAVLLDTYLMQVRQAVDGRRKASDTKEFV